MAEVDGVCPAPCDVDNKMSWYVLLNGRQVWTDTYETIFTVGDTPEEALPCEVLNYMTMSSSKAVYAEHIVHEDADGKNGRAKARTSGRQRGFIVRADDVNDRRCRVGCSLQAAIDTLIKEGVACKVDVDDPTLSGAKRTGRKKAAAAAAGDTVDETPMMELGSNECRVEITSRVQHQTHGFGYRVIILEPGTKQKVHIFVADKELTEAAFHKHLVNAIEANGGKTALGRMVVAPSEDHGGAGAAAPKKEPSKGGKLAVAKPLPKPKERDEAQEDEDDWLSSVMGLGKAKATAEAIAGAAAAEGGAEEGAAAAPAPKPRRERAVPPWLR